MTQDNPALASPPVPSRSSTEGRGRTALVTGASAGIGKELALVFAAHHFDIVLVARRKERLDELASEIARKHGVRTHVMVADLSDPATPRQIFDEMVKQRISVDALVNNAGFAVPGKFRDTQWEEQRQGIQVMAVAVAELCHLFGPGMAARGYGRILNVASFAAFLPGVAGATLYSACKAFVVKMSEAMAVEYQGKNVHVTALCPGLTYSEFHDVAGNRKEMSRTPQILWMDAATVAREGYDSVMLGDVVWINGFINRILGVIARFLPRAFVSKLLQIDMGHDKPRQKAV
jgi:short-subunit dehydrogenase